MVDQKTNLTPAPSPKSPEPSTQNPASTLPLQLFEEGDWQACRTECARILISHPTPEFHLMHAICGLRLGLNTKPELKNLCSPPKQNISIRGAALPSVVKIPQQNKSTLPSPPKSRSAKRNWLEPVTAMNEENDNPVNPCESHPQNHLSFIARRAEEEVPRTQPQIPAMAHYELGRAYWIEGNNSNAFYHLKKSFLTTTTADLHQRSGCSLYILLKENPKLAAGSTGLQTILATCRTEWDRELFNGCSKPKEQKSNIATAPGRWLISFYQKQIGPAIGDRCSLHPSCSRYAMQALKTHGMVGAGAMGDRFIREPDVVKYRQKPTDVNGHIKYSDPLSDHDWWMKK